MDNKYENIVPWNGANDTGLDVRKKLERNYTRIAGNFEELAKIAHDHSNKAVLDNLTQAVIDNSHTHANKTTLDVIDQSLSTASAVKFAKVTATDAELGTIKATTGDFSGAIKAAAATVIGLITCATLNADAATIPTINSTNINASTQVVSPLFVGRLQGNADTASRLQTARTIWGHTFNGTADISGDFYMGNYTSIRFRDTLGVDRNAIFADDGNRLMIGYGWAAAQHNTLIDGYNLYLRYGSAQSIGLTLNSSGNIGIGTTSPLYKLHVAGIFGATGATTLGSTLSVASDATFGGNLGTANYISQSQGWRVTNAGNADFRTIYTDELHATAFTADVSQALAGSDYLTKSVSKLSANFVVPAVGSSVRIIVDDLEGFPSTACFENGDYIRFRAFNKTSGLTISDVWGTVQLDTTFGTSGFSNGTQAYIYTVTSAAVTGISVYKGSEVLDYGKSSDGLIVRTTLDKNNSPYSQITTWVNDPSNSANYTVHARLGKLSGIAHCSGYGLYTDNAYLTNSIVVGDLTKTNNYLSYNPTEGLVIKGNLYVYSGAVASTNDVNTAKTSAITTAATDATNKVNAVQIGGTNLAIYSTCVLINMTLADGVFTQVTADSRSTLDLFIITYQDSTSVEIPYTHTISSAGKYEIEITPTLDFNRISIKTNGADRDTSVIFSNSKFVKNKSYKVSINFVNITQGSYSWKEIKIEEGNKATSWSPAPEDVDAAISLKVSSTDYNGNTIASLINQSATTVKIQASQINLTGAVTFSSLDSSTQGVINAKADTSTVNQQVSNAITTAATDATNKVNAIQIGGRNLFISGSYNTKMVTISGSGDGSNEFYYETDIHAYLQAGIQYIFSCNTDGVWVGNSGEDTVEAFLLKDKGYNTIYRMDSKVYTFTPSVSGWYYLRLDVNQNNKSHWFSEIKIEEGNKKTTYTPAPEDIDTAISTSQTNSQNNLAVKIGYASYDDMVAKATAGNTIINGAYIRTTLIESVAVLTEGLKAHKVNADDIDTTSITSSTAFVNSLTANTAFINNLKTNIVNAAYVNTLSLNAAAIKVGTIDTARMNASDIVTKGLQAKTIDAMNATIQNITVTNATISGTLNGCTGIFSGNLSGVKGTIGGWTIQDGGLYNSVSGTGFIKLEVNGGRQLSINSSADSPVLAIRSDSKPALRIYTQDNGGAGIDITAQTTSWAVTSHGKVQLVSRNTEGTFINMLCKCQVVVTSSGTIGSTICWVDPVDNLQFMPNRILCINTSDITITLPDTANIKDGYEIEFRHLWSNYVTIKSYNNLSNIVLNNAWYDNKTNQRTLDGAYIARYTWCASRAFWVEEYHL